MFEIFVTSFVSCISIFSYLFKRLLNPCTFKKGINLLSSKTDSILNSSILDLTGTSFFKVTNDLDNLA